MCHTVVQLFYTTIQFGFNRLAGNLLCDLHRHAAVDHDDLASNVAGLIGGEEGGGVGNVFRFAEVGQGDAGEQSLASLLRNGM